MILLAEIQSCRGPLLPQPTPQGTQVLWAGRQSRGQPGVHGPLGFSTQADLQEAE